MPGCGRLSERIGASACGSEAPGQQAEGVVEALDKLRGSRPAGQGGIESNEHQGRVSGASSASQGVVDATGASLAASPEGANGWQSSAAAQRALDGTTLVAHTSREAIASSGLVDRSVMAEVVAHLVQLRSPQDVDEHQQQQQQQQGPQFSEAAPRAGPVVSPAGGGDAAVLAAAVAPGSPEAPAEE
uniref:Uncharacterized protein n=1 Tax=Cafeteria roenbergensis TaxID=33653 RepID=A0A7S0JPZ0_CAFRO